MPPNPKLLLIITSIFLSLALLGVTSKSHSGSRFSILMVGGTIPSCIALRLIAASHHMTAPSLEGPAKSMRMALKNAKMEASEIDYINAHGTSTPLGDKNEIKAIKVVFGEDAKRLSISATKSMHGHALGGAGGIEAAISLKAMQEGIVPPTINIENLDPECDLDVTPNKAKERKIDVIMSNSFGFGGTNATLIFKKYS